MKTIMTNYFLSNVMKSMYVLYNEFYATITVVNTYWQWTLWKSSKSRYIDLVKWKQHQLLTNSAMSED